MSFAHPEVLPWLWTLVAIPLLYLVRRRARTAAVPHLFLWERVLERRGRTPLRRIRGLLSILLQAAIMTALILAWAGPEREAVTTRRVPVAVVFDTSLSMSSAAVPGGRTSRLEAARGALEQHDLAALLRVGDVAVFTCDDAVLPLQAFTSDINRLRGALTRLPEPSARFDPSVFIRWVEELRRTGNAVHVVLLTDGASMGAEVLDDAGVTVVRVGERGANAGIVDVSLEDLAGDVVRIVATVAAVGGDATGTVVARGEASERAEAPVSVGEDARLEVALELRLDGDEPTWIDVAYVPDAESGDLLGADDSAGIRRPPRQRLSVLVVAEEVDEHVTRALSVLPDLVDREAAATVTPGSWRRAAIGRDVVILCGVEEARPLPEGRYLLLGSAAPGLPLSFERPEKDVEITGSSRGDPLLRGLDLRDLAIERARPVRVGDGASVVLEGNTGALISRGEAGGVRFVHTAFDISRDETSLVLLPAWPLMMKDALEWLAPIPRRTFPEAVSAGRPFAAALPVTPPLSARPEGGAARELRGAGGGAWIAPREPGRWTFSSREGEEEVAVNVCDPAQTDVVTKLAQDRVGEWPAPTLAPAATDCTAWFVAAALLLLLLEWLLYHAAWTR